MFSLLFQQPILFFSWALAFLIALSVHEFSHALVGTWLGDSTAKRMGRLTLNPAAHIDPLGLFAVLMIGFGWGKPVPYNPYNLRWPKWGPVAIAFAGPISNLLMAIIAVFLLANLGPSLGPQNLLFLFLVIVAQLSIMLAVFNLIPLPPLDGSKALLALLSHPKYAAARAFIETRGPMILLLLIVMDAFGGLGLLSGLIRWAIGLVAKLADFPIFL